MFSPINSNGLSARERPHNGAFTLVELMVAMFVFAIVAVLLFSVVSNLASMSNRYAAQAAGFQKARFAIDMIKMRLSQATLNTYWDYYDAAGLPSTHSNYTPPPSKYGRMAELHFVSGPSARVLPASNPAVRPSHAVFFQSPLGFTENRDERILTRLLNACGYFIEFGSDKDFMPLFLRSHPGIEEKFRFRLLQFLEPSGDLSIYGHPLDRSWYLKSLQSGDARPVQILAENVIAFVILPKLPAPEDESGFALVAPDYVYDSRVEKKYTATPSSGGSTSGSTLHQIPPLVDIIMVVLEEPSAARLQDSHGGTPPDLGLEDLFKDASAEQLQKDLRTLEETLLAEGLKFRILRSTVALEGAKWSKG